MHGEPSESLIDSKLYSFQSGEFCLKFSYLVNKLLLVILDNFIKIEEPNSASYLNQSCWSASSAVILYLGSYLSILSIRLMPFGLIYFYSSKVKSIWQFSFAIKI